MINTKPVTNKIVKMEMETDKGGIPGYITTFENGEKLWVYEGTINQALLMIFDCIRLVNLSVSKEEEYQNSIKDGKKYIENETNNIVEAVPAWKASFDEHFICYKKEFKAANIDLWTDGYKIKYSDKHIGFLEKEAFEKGYTLIE